MHGHPPAECAIVVRSSFAQLVEKARALEECCPKPHEPVTCEMCSSKADRWLKEKMPHEIPRISGGVFGKKERDT